MTSLKKTQLSFTSEELTVLSAALGEIPYRVAAPLIASINRQIQEDFDRARDEHAPSGGPAPSVSS